MATSGSDAGSGKPRILLQLDTDAQASVFDAVVAIDSGVDHLLSRSGVEPGAARGLIHGAIFTRGLADLRHTAVFVGGSDAARAEAVYREALGAFFGPFRVSVMLDPNGANTTAAAAMLAAFRTLGTTRPRGAAFTVLGGTGPVGERVCRLAAGVGARVRLVSRDEARAKAAAERVRTRVGGDAVVEGCASGDPGAIEGAEVVVAAGAAGVELLSADAARALASARALIDLNAVPPAGIGGVEATARGETLEGSASGARAWGALGVGGIKMKIHKGLIRRLFETNDGTFDAEEALAAGIAAGLGADSA